MYGAADFKVCLSSFEFSIFFTNPAPKYCPSCAHFLDSADACSEVRISSLLILVGVGSFMAYKYFLNQTKKLKRTRRTSQRQRFKEETREYDYYEEPSEETEEEESPVRRWFRGKSRSTSTPFHPSQKYNISDETESTSDTSEVILNETPLTSLTRSFSIGSEFSGFGDGTVAKLDVLLNQIEDIKKSVVEMDADLFTVNKVMKKSNKSFLRLTVNPDEESSDQTGAEASGPHSPSLEWDSNDIIAQTFFFTDNQSLTPRVSSGNPDSSSDESNTSSGPIVPVMVKRQSNPLSPALNLPLDNFSVSSSSGNGSLVSSPQSPGTERGQQLHKLIEQARKLGLVNELLDALVLQNIKRDSAYFED
jgi:ribosomal protein S21